MSGGRRVTDGRTRAAKYDAADVGASRHCQVKRGGRPGVRDGPLWLEQRSLCRGMVAAAGVGGGGGGGGVGGVARWPVPGAGPGRVATWNGT